MSEKPKPALRNPSTYINGLERTDEYLSSLGRSGSRTAAIGHTAAIYSDRMSKEPSLLVEKQLDHFAVRMISTLPDFLEGRIALESIEADRRDGFRVMPNARKEQLEKVIPFDHTLRDMIDMIPELRFNDVVRFAKAIALNLHTPNLAAYTEQATREILIGMQHEIGLKQVLKQIEGVTEVNKATLDQEMNGIDLLVSYNGVQLALDAKASQQGAQKAVDAWYLRLSKGADVSHSGYPIWTRIDYEDFGGEFKISDDRAKKIAPYIKSELDQIQLKLRAVS